MVTLATTVYLRNVLLRRCLPHVRIVMLVLYIDILHEYQYLYYCCCLLALWNLVQIRTFALYHKCNSCCRENLAQPVVCNSRQLVRVGGS